MPETIKKTELFRFDQMAVQVKDKVEPEEADVDRYVGLEHIDPESLKIRRWGEPSDVESSKILFRSGDIIFGKRRAYQRKLAVADFDGICSAHAMVLRPKTDVVLKEFLPFFMQSDIFMDRAVKISVGGLSPTINWRDLAKEEFALPRLEEQRRIAEVLQAAQELKERLRFAREALSDVSSSWIESSLASNEWSESVATDVLDRATVGIVIKPAALYVPEGTGIPALRSLNIAPHRIVMSDCVNISHEGHRDHKKSRLQPGDLAIVRSGRPGDAAVIPDGLGELNCIDLIIATPGEHLRSEFLCAVLNSRYGRRQFASGIAGTAQKHFNVGLFKKLKIPVPSLETQDGFIAHMHQLQHATTSLEDRQKVQGDVARSLLEEVMSI